jgi:glycosyltransferase involved in cell wall biosynthesis
LPRLSVILPARDAGTTISMAVRSTLGALPKDSELVVLDDGSSDDTADVLDAIHDRRLRVLRGGSSGSVGGALNRLLDATDSELVGRMDADDYTLPWRFRLQTQAIRRGADLVFSSVIPFTPAARRVNIPIPLQIDARAFPFHLLLSNPVSHPTLLARREALTAAGGYRGVPSEDYDLWVRAATHGSRLTRMGTPTLMYRLHPAQITASQEWRQASWQDPILNDAFADLSSQIVGRRLSRLVNVSGTVAERFSAIEEFRTAVNHASRSLPPIDRAVLLRRMRRRLESVAHASE